MLLFACIFFFINCVLFTIVFFCIVMLIIYLCIVGLFLI